MARKLRLEYAGAVNHVMSHGNQWNRIFRDDADLQRLLDSLGKALLRELLERMTGHVRAEHYGSKRADAMEAQAQRMVREELVQLGWDEAVLEMQGRSRETGPGRSPARPDHDDRGLMVRRLRMGTPSHLNLLHYRQRRSQA